MSTATLEPPKKATTASNLDRNQIIERIKAALKRRSSTPWSVRGGSGTAWGWITISCAPRLKTWRMRPLPHNTDERPGKENWEAYDSGEPNGEMPPAIRKELAQLLGLEYADAYGISIPASSDYRQEYLDRAEGKTPSVVGKPYWD